MRKTIIVSQDKRAPNDMIGKNYTIMSRDEFIDLGNSEEGIDVEEKIYFNIDSLNQFLYEAIKESPIYDLAIFYKFSDQDVAPDFEITEGIRVYEVVSKEDKTNKQERAEENQAEPEASNNEVEKQESTEAPKPTDIEPPVTPENLTDNVDIVGNVEQDAKNPVLDKENLLSLLGSKYEFRDQEKKKEPAKVIVFGSSKGGTGKSTTCLICARRYAKTHPEEKVALADFDIIDG